MFLRDTLVVRSYKLEALIDPNGKNLSSHSASKLRVEQDEEEEEGFSEV